MFCQNEVTSGASGNRPAIPTMATARVSATLDRPLSGWREELPAEVVGHRRPPRHDDFVIASRTGDQLLDKVSAPLVHRDNRDALLGELLLDLRCRHAEGCP